MNPLKLAHEIHDLVGAREIKRMTIEIDNRIHEIIESYARRGAGMMALGGSMTARRQVPARRLN